MDFSDRARTFATLIGEFDNSPSGKANIPKTLNG